MPFGRLRESVRAGAADVLGFREQLDHAATIEDRFVEATADARMLQRRLEDATGWDNLSGSANTAYFDVTRVLRREEVRKAYLYYFRDAIVGRTVDLFTNYCFGRGVPKPKYNPRPKEQQGEAEVEEQAKDPEAEAGQAALDAFWTDPANQQVLFGTAAQKMKATELQLQANVFLLLIGEEEGDEEEIGEFSFDAPPLRVSDLPEQEVVDVISHPGEKKIPVYYKREYTPRVYNFQSATYEPGEKVTRYYRDWKFDPPEQWPDAQGQMQPWGPPEDQIGSGRVYHISVNRTSDMKFGVPEAARFLKWAQGLNEYMTSRMALVQTLAQLAMKAKVQGGPTYVEQVRGQIQELSSLAGAVEGTLSGTMRRDPAARTTTKVPVENQGVELQPNVQDSGSANAQNDIRTFKGQIAAGSGIPVHHLGDEGTANLATATSMDAPLQRLCEAVQELWEGVYRDLCGEALERAGLDPARLEVTMPPILQRDANLTMQIVTGLLGAVDPNITNRDLVRFAVGEVLDSMGKVNTPELLDQFFPENWVSPMEQTLLVGQMQMAMGAGAEAQQQAEVNAAAGRQQVANAAEEGDTAVRRGRRLAGRDQGPQAAVQASAKRAADRRERSVSTPAEAFVEAGLGESTDADPTPPFDLPPALAEIAQRVMALDGHLAEVESNGAARD